MTDQPDPAALAEAHRIAQIRESAKVEAALARLWVDTVDPNDFDRTFLLFRERALPLLQAGISRSQSVADGYLAELYASKGLPRLPQAPIVPGDSGYLRGRVAIGTGSLYTGHALRTGRGNPDELMAAALAGMLRESKRTMLNAGRSRVESLGARDTRRFARVSDGKPCAFCAMLVSRGPVYSAATVDFRTHAGCGCGTRPVLPGDPDRGWTPEARRLRKVWTEVAKGDPTDFRRVVENRFSERGQWDLGLKERLDAFLEAEQLDSTADAIRPQHFENLAALIALIALRTRPLAPIPS